MYLNNKHFEKIYFGNKTPWIDYKITRLSKNAVKLDHYNYIVIIYINTIVTTYNKIKKTILLDTAGYQTETTKKWINYGLSLAKSNYHITQEKFIWYAKDNKNPKDTIEYKDYMILKNK